ncbi:hypothetical protein PoB_001455400 [Plakobranchus ocellatus]|uniref:Uncharacterized protein n=1 Tax=Plakobranchus ocellatus TaxID=259542 RepID=A0AAV3YYC8_9GAST|nr:hypothetical protein PoB_001455400 [Plakobranchus ocellatus]
MIGQPCSYLRSDHLDRAGSLGKVGENRLPPCHTQPFLVTPIVQMLQQQRRLFGGEKKQAPSVTSVVACPALLRDDDLSSKV